MTGYSPLLAIATGSFELLAAAYVLRSPGRTQILRPVAGILLFLAGYQWLEVLACGSVGDTTYARLALADVIWLPPLGVLLVSRLAAPEDNRLRWCCRTLFVMAAGLAAFIMTDPTFVRQTVCQTVIATYRTPGLVYQAYGAYYQLGLMTMIFGASWAMARIDDGLTRRHLSNVQMGTLGFVLPSLLTELVMPQYGSSTPSVMCHFALVLAISLTHLAVMERRFALENGQTTQDLTSVVRPA